MTKNDIIIDLNKRKVVERIASSFWSYLQDSKDDFIQHIYLVLLELPEEKLIGMYERKELEYYTYYVARAQATGSKSDFWSEQTGRLDTTPLEVEKTNLRDEENS